jgi:hypothetical protein
VAALSDQEGCADLLCRFLTALTGEETSDALWAAAADGCALWLVRDGIPESLGNDRLTMRSGDS